MEDQHQEYAGIRYNESAYAGYFCRCNSRGSQGKLNYLKVQAEESAADETAAAETQEITEEQTAATEETTTQAQ